MRAGLKQQSLVHKMPYLFFDQGVLILDDGTLITGMSLNGVDTFSMTGQEIETLKAKWSGVFKTLSPGYHVQVMHIYENQKAIDHNEKRPFSQHPVAKVFAESYQDHLVKRLNNKVVRCFVFLIRPGNGSANLVAECLSYLKNRLTKSHVRNAKEGPGIDYSERHQDILLKTETIKNNFMSLMGMPAHTLKDTQFEAVIYGLMNPSRTYFTQRHQREFEAHQNPFVINQTVRERVTQSAVEVFSEQLKVGDQYCSMLVMNRPPNLTVACDSDNLLYNLPYPCVWSFGFDISDTQKINAKLEAKQKRKYAYMASSSNPNVGSRMAKTQIEQAIEEQKAYGFTWHEAVCHFMINDADSQRLKEKVSDLVSRLARTHETELIVAKYDQMGSWLSLLPGLSYRHKRKTLFTSSNVADLVPLTAPNTGTETKDIYFHTYRDTLFGFSTFSDEFNNWNQVVMGKTGSGKSFIVNNILTTSLMHAQNPQVMILDLGKSFKKTTELWGGKYITIDLDDPDTGLNPLPPHDAFFEKGEFASLGLLDFVVQQIQMMAGSDQDTKIQPSIIRRALIATYERITERTPILSDLRETLLKYNTLESDEDDIHIAKSLARHLDDFTNGAYARLFNRPSEFNIDVPFFCFDFKEAHANMRIREIATYVIGGYITRRMTQNAGQKYVIFDEFSTTMSHETGAALCRMIAKNCRKHGVSFICISQELEDFMSTPAGQAVYNQSNFKWFLKLDDNLAKHQNSLRLSERDVQVIRSLNTSKGEYSQVYLFYGGQKVMLCLYPDPLLYWACTNDSRDNQMEALYQKRFKKDRLAVIQMLSQKYPKGVREEELVVEKEEDICVA